MFLTIDGVNVPNLGRFLVTSPVFDFTVPENNVLGVPSGFGQSLSNGYFVILPPLSVGTHVIRYGGTFPEWDASLEITYNLTVAR